MLCWNPYFIVFLGAHFLGQVVKKGKFWTPTKNTLTDNWKAHVWAFVCFLFFCWLFVLFIKKGHVRWPEGPPHLALNPPYLFFSLFVWFFFLSLLLMEKNCVSPLKRAFLFIFECLPLFLLSLFWPHTCSISLSLSLSLSLSISFSFFLPSCLSFFAFFCFLPFVSFFVFQSFLLLFNENNNMKYSITINPFSFSWVSCLVFSFKSLFLILVFFLILSYVFCSTWMFLVSKQTS